MDALRARKFQRYFSALDSNDDGRLSKDDFELAGLRYAEKLGYAVGSAEQRRLSEMSVALWTDMVSQMDTDGVGGVTHEEFQAAIEQYLGIDPAGYAAQIGPVADAYFNLADSDSDGEISQEEFTKLFSAVARIPETEVAATFSAIRAGHAEMSRDQLHEAMVEFCYGTDPQAPANHLFGRL